MELIAITKNGELAKPLLSTPPTAVEVVDATTKLYRKVGYQIPWIGYLAFEEGTCVGACGFTAPPKNNRVEIAYFTFPEHESRGVATRMASQLIGIALDKMPGVLVIAHTFAGRKPLHFHFEKAWVSPGGCSGTPRGWIGLGVAAKR